MEQCCLFHTRDSHLFKLNLYQHWMEMRYCRVIIINLMYTCMDVVVHVSSQIMSSCIMSQVILAYVYILEKFTVIFSLVVSESRLTIVSHEAKL